MLWNLILNAVFIIAVGIGIFYVWRLQKTLSGLSQSREDMEAFVRDFSGSIQQAQKAIRELQSVARDVGEDVGEHLQRAQGLRDELSFLVEAADSVATRLADKTSHAQQDAKQARQQQPEKLQEKPVEKISEPPANTRSAEHAVPEIKKAEPASVQEPPAKTVPAWAKRAEATGPVINAPVENAAPVSGLQFGSKKPAQKIQEEKTQ